MAGDNDTELVPEDRVPAGGVHQFASGAAKVARSKRGLTLNELALLVDCSAPTVSAWEGGRSSPNPRHLAKLAEVLGVHVDDLLRVPANRADLAGLRDRAGLTGTEVAAALALHKTSWSRIEHGYRPIPQRSLPVLAALYQLDEDAIQQAWTRTREAATRRARR